MLTEIKPKTEKLVRDKIIYFSVKKGDRREFRIAKDSEILALLAEKIVEEALELREQILKGDPTLLRQQPHEIIEEMGDCITVMDEIADRLQLRLV